MAFLRLRSLQRFLRWPSPAQQRQQIAPIGSLLLALTLAGCGGGGSSDNTPTSPPAPPAPTSGLTERLPLAPLTLPGTASAEITLTQRFPAIQLSQAIQTSPIPGSTQLVVARQNGQITQFDATENGDNATVVADLSAQVRAGGEEGLLGFAFDPNFTTNRHLFVHYTPDGGDRRGRISRFEWTGATVDNSSELIIIEVPQPFANHNGGTISFGPDGMLYIALGDGGSGGDPQNNAQNSENLLGAILRLDVSAASVAQPYQIPSDNPWVNQPPNRGELWAIGLRNPFRMSFDRATGELWAGDVGQADREEIDLITRGGNYGWRVREGTLPFDDSANTLPLDSFVEPVIDLERDLARSITGGDVYRGSRFPGLNGAYIYGDFATENIWRLRRRANAAPENVLIGSVPLPAHFGPDGEGELLITSYTQGLFGLEAGTGNSNPASLLSETGLFSDLSTLTPAQGFIEYGVNQPHWVDGAESRYWLGVPETATLSFREDDTWEAPEGSVLLQHLEIETADQGRRRLETRLLALREGRWQAFTFVWNETQDDAALETAGLDIALSLNQPDGSTQSLSYRVPNQGECLSCHTNAAGTALGLNTRQMNRAFSFAGISENQIQAFNGVGLFASDVLATQTLAALPAHTAAGTGLDTTDPEVVSASARSYLAVNCANCHRPDGPTGSTLDLRAQIPDSELNALDELPLSGDFGLPNARLIAPGAAGSSVLLERMNRLDGTRMPPFGRRVDPEGTGVIERWINQL